MEGIFEVGKIDMILGAFRASDAWGDRGEIEFEVHAVVALALDGDAPEFLGFVVIFESGDLSGGSPGADEVGDGFFVDAEEAHGGAVFGGHIGDGGAIDHGERAGTWAVEFDELADHLGFAKDLGDVEDDIGGGDAFGDGADEVNADDFWGEEIDWLAEHPGFGFDAADAPTDDPEAVDHRGMGVSADEGIWVIDAIFFEDTFGEIFEIHLVDDADSWWDDAESFEGLLAPLEEHVAFTISFKFEVEIFFEGGGVAKEVDLDGVIDHEIDGDEGFDHFGVAAEASDGRAHGGEIDEEGDAGEVLEDDASDDEGDFDGSGGVGVPVGESADVFFADAFSVAIAEDAFEDDADANGEAGDATDA